MHFVDAPERVFGSRAKIRILRTLYNMKEDELTGREIARRCQLTPARTHAVLRDLAVEGLVKMRVLGRNHMFKFNPASVLMPTIKLIFDPAHSPEAHLRSLASNDLSDRRILSAFAYGPRIAASGATADSLKIMIIADSEASLALLSKRIDSFRDRIQAGLGEVPEIRPKSVDQFRSLAQAADTEVKGAIETNLVLIGESPMTLTSQKQRPQRFHFPLFRRS